jgi:antitoxin PrlF
MTDITKVSTKGQVVIPQDLRDALGLEAGATVAVQRVDDYLVLKKVVVPDLLSEFRRLSARGGRLARQAGIRSQDDVVKLVRKIRKEKFAKLKRKKSR